MQQLEYKGRVIKESFFNRKNINKYEAIFTQGNGYIGIRNSLEEHYVGEIRDTFITGTFNKASEDEVSELPNIADMSAVKIIIDGTEFSLTEGEITFYERSLDLSTGESLRNIVWKSPSGVRVELSFRRFVSLYNEHLFVQKVDLLCDSDVDIIIESGIDGSVTNSGAMHFEDIKRRVYEGKYMEYISRTTQSKVSVVQDAVCRLNKEAAVIPVMGRRTLENKYSLKLKANEKLEFEKRSVFFSTRDKELTVFLEDDRLEEAKKRALKLIIDIENTEYSELFKSSESVWKEYLKKSEIIVGTDDEYVKTAINFALYHLRIMVKADDNRVGIGAKALSGEGYKGHSFWDTELFILPYFTYTHPEIARTLLEYRYHNLYGARLKAKEHGYEGAMYPWECAWVDDGEVTPLYMGADIVTGEITKIWTGLIEHHITADIVYAIDHYYKVTNDIDYMENYGYEIIFEAALFWASRLEYIEDRDRYEIRDVIGPDEYKEHVDNNAYTNYMAAYTMKLALKNQDYLKNNNRKIYDALDLKLDIDYIKELIEKKLPKLYLPMPDKDGIIPQSDTFLQLKKLDISKYKNAEAVLGIYNDYNTKQLNEYMVSKQSDTVMLLYLFRDLFDYETRKKNFVFYEDKTLHDSSLSKSTHAVLANEFKFEEMAYKLFKGAISVDLGPNMKSSDEGIHSASIGGIWAIYVLGFGGVNIDKNGLNINPRLPKEWSFLEFPLIYKGSSLRVRIEKDNKVSIKKLQGNSVEIYIKGEKQLIK